MIQGHDLDDIMTLSYSESGGDDFNYEYYSLSVDTFLVSY